MYQYIRLLFCLSQFGLYFLLLAGEDRPGRGSFFLRADLGGTSMWPGEVKMRRPGDGAWGDCRHTLGSVGPTPQPSIAEGEPESRREQPDETGRRVSQRSEGFMEVPHWLCCFPLAHKLIIHQAARWMVREQIRSHLSPALTPLFPHCLENKFQTPYSVEPIKPREI